MFLVLLYYTNVYNCRNMKDNVSMNITYKYD